MTEATTFSTRQAPWMKVGQLVESTQTAAEAAKLGGLDFDITLRPAGFRNAKGNWQRVANRLAVTREDTEEVFEFVSKRYEPLQYREAFDFMDTISPKYVAAGALSGGRQGFLVVQPEHTVAPSGDDIEMFVVLRTSHDRSRGIEVMYMPLRGLCMNQLTLSGFSKQAKQRWTVPHLSTMHDKLAEARNTLTQLDDYAAEFNRVTEQLMATSIGTERARGILDEVVKNGGQKRDEVIDEVLDLFENDTERVGFNGTGWGLVNALSEYLDWRQPSRGGAEHKFTRALGGYTRTALNRATQLALAA